MTTTDLARGTRVRFTDGPLGLLDAPGGRKFAEPLVNAGDLGTYIGPEPIVGADWHMVKVVLPEVTHDLYAPVHRSQFEVVA